MKALYTYLREHPVAYITRHKERADGIPEDTPGYRIVAEPSKSTREQIKDLENPNNESLLLFKPNRQVETICKQNRWNLLNPSADLAERVEAKISQTRWLSDLARYLPSFAIRTCKELRFDGEPIIVQFNHSHSGLGTILLDSNEKLEYLMSNFPDRPVRITRFVKGPMITSNNIVAGERVLLGSISYQITGLPAFTDNPFATVGNDWGLGTKLATGSIRDDFNEIVHAVGKRLSREGWRGCYGVDAIIEEGTNKIYLIEINARQTASVSFESQIQKSLSISGVTSFEAHFTALLNLPFGEDLIPITFGSRLIRRVMQTPMSGTAIAKVKELGLDTVEFPKDELGEDLLHIRSMNASFMQEHGKLSDLGERIVAIL